MAAILSHEREINQSANTLQGTLKIVMLRTVRLSQCGCQYGRNTAAEIAHFLSLPLCEFAIALFWDTKSRIRWNFFSASSNACCYLSFFRYPSTHCIINLNMPR